MQVTRSTRPSRIRGLGAHTSLSLKLACFGLVFLSFGILFGRLFTCGFHCVEALKHHDERIHQTGRSLRLASRMARFAIVWGPVASNTSSHGLRLNGRPWH